MLSRVRLCNPMDCSLSLFSVYGIFQARVLEWVAISFSRGSSRPRDRTWVSQIIGRPFTVWATREVHNSIDLTNSFNKHYVADAMGMEASFKYLFKVLYKCFQISGKLSEKTVPILQHDSNVRCATINTAPRISFIICVIEIEVFEYEQCFWKANIQKILGNKINLRRHDWYA